MRIEGITALAQGIEDWIQKPITLAQLAQVVGIKDS